MAPPPIHLRLPPRSSSPNLDRPSPHAPTHSALSVCAREIQRPRSSHLHRPIRSDRGPPHPRSKIPLADTESRNPARSPYGQVGWARSGQRASERMGESHAQTLATRRGSNPRFEPPPVAIDIPPTPPAKSPPHSFLSLILPFSLEFTAAASSSSLLTTAVVISLWYCSNIGVLLLNKYLLSIHGYRYPVFLTALHMISCSSYSFLFLRFFRLAPLQPLSSRKQLSKIAALSAIFCLSVVAGNTSLRYIPVSFNQAIGATTPFFTAVFAFALTCRREPPLVYLSLLPVVLGIVLASNSEPLFHLFGFLVCLCSTAGRALKSVVQGIILTSEAEKLNSMNLLMYMAPIAAAILLPLSFYIEGNVAAVTFDKAAGDPGLLWLLFGNATVAYFVNLSNFLVTKHTSALTLQVLGNAKAAVAAVVSVLIFKNPVNVMGIVGFGITIFGVVLYSEAKKRTNSSNSPSNSNSNASGSAAS